MEEKEIGVVTHYFGNISVGIVKLNALLKVGDTIHIKGAHDDFTQDVNSIQIEHEQVDSAKKGDLVGIKVTKKVHANDKVFLVTP
jgi:translation elongation factor EF-1alpha